MVKSETSTPEQDITRKAKALSWSPFSALITVIAIYIAATVCGEGLLYAYGLLHHWSNGQFVDWINKSTWAQFISTFLIYALMAAGVYWFIRSHKGSLRSLGVRKPRWSDFGMTLLAAPVYVLAYVIILGFVRLLVPSLNTSQQQQLGFTPNGIHATLILTFISLVVLPPLIEEFIMRGFVFTSLLKRNKFWLATLITSILFAIAHLQFGSGAPLLWVAAIDTFVLSLVLCYLRYKSDSLWPGIGLHALKNLIAFSLVFVFPFVHGTMSGSMILHGVHHLLPFLPAL